MLEKVFNTLDAIYPETVYLRRFFHQYPELSFQEEKTPAKISEYLNHLGIETRTMVGGRGVVGVIQGKHPGKTVAIRADFDALPIQDEKQVPYCSKVPGVMHACGHDAHTALLLSIAKALQTCRDHIKGKIVFIHQFAEEVPPGGALPMIADGCLEGVDAIFGTHLWTPIPVGKIAFRKGPIMAAADNFTAVVKGKGGHGGQPHETVDPIIIASNYLQMLQQIPSRMINPIESAVISVCSFHAGETFNVIPDQAVIKGTVRTFKPEIQNLIIEQMETLLRTLCLAKKADYEFDYKKGYPSVVNHPEETELLAACARKVVGIENVFETEPLMVGEDFSYYLQKVPGTFFLTGAGNPEKSASFPHHHAKFDIDERAMLYAAKVLAAAAIRFLQNE
jgi:amidohydrolase